MTRTFVFGAQNDTKEFNITLDHGGIHTCVVVDFGDG